MVLMVEKRIRGGICNSIYQYTEVRNIYMKEYENIENYEILCTGM